MEFGVCDSVNNCGDYSDELNRDSTFCGKFDYYNFFCKNLVMQKSL